MQAIKFQSIYAANSHLICHRFKKHLKLKIFRCSKYFISQNKIIFQPSRALQICPSKHSNFFKNVVSTPSKNFSTGPCVLEKKEFKTATIQAEEDEKLSLFQRYKKMLKEYWYVLIPVHIATSTVWFGLFYYIAKSGFDITPFLEMLSVPETIIKPLRNSSLGYLAVASALYKLATPGRYMVTLGGTTVAIKQLTKRGLIKPVLSKDKLKTMIQNKLQAKKGSTNGQNS